VTEELKMYALESWRRSGGVTQWWSSCLVCVRHWVSSQTSQNEEEKRQVGGHDISRKVEDGIGS
jgi:hypothetical protein